ncbi:MAG: PQQ-dependent sugar dehydrogenase [Deinococcota bacterium]
MSRNGVRSSVYNATMMFKAGILKHLLMMPLTKLGLVVLLASVISACSSTEAISLQLVTEGLEQPVAVTHNGIDERMFVVEQRGRIRIVEAGQLLQTPFLDVSSIISTGGERGLLSLAFHPNYDANGRFFVNYTDRAGNTVIAEYRVSDDANVANPDSARALLTFEQPFSNHNGGQLAFGPDGYLYIGTGDGGAADDPLNAGQDLTTLLGKLLRIDVDTDDGAAYRVPADNPFVNTKDVRPEIWAYGLRNPWRFSFDTATGDLFMADVGQNAFEEVNFQPASSTGGENYGWRISEGAHCFNPSEGCDTNGQTLPILEYSHRSGAGRSITGGYRYRGREVASLDGAYVFGDFVSGNMWAARFDGSAWASTYLMDSSLAIATFGQDAAGELYVADYNAGRLYKFIEE